MMDILNGKNTEDFVAVNKNVDLADDANYRIFDTYYAGKYGILSEIRVKSECVVDAIQFVYNKNDCTPLNGGPGGELQSLSLKDGEHIIRIDWITGIWEGFYENEVVAYVCFYTNLGNTLSAGDPDRCVQTTLHSKIADSGKYIHAFKGRSDKYLLGFDGLYMRAEDWYMFNDTLYVQGMHRVSEIRINSGYVVDGIQLVYDDNIETHYHGGHGGSRTTLKLQDGEYITAISGKTGEYKYQDGKTLCSIKFLTSNGRSISGGTARECRNLEDFSFTAEDDMQIFALSGSYSHYMCSVKVGMYTMRDNVSETDINVMGEECFNKGSISLMKAVDSGCISKRTLEKMHKRTTKAVTPKSVCARALKNQKESIIGSLVTSLCVTTPQCVFRSPLAKEVKYIEETGKTLSKVIRDGDETQPIITQEDQNGKQFDYATILRILATKSSAEPKSQFSSFALDFKTASSFGDNVYAVNLIPNSPLLGLGQENKLGTGEDQFQILGGTPVIELYRLISPSKFWQVYDFKKKKWNMAYKIPYNKEYDEYYKKNYMGEV